MLQDEAARTLETKGTAPAKPATLQIIGKGQDCAVAVLENYVFLCWRRAIVPIGSTWTRKAFMEVRRQYPDGKIAFFTVVDATCSLDTPAEVRKELATMLETYDEHLAGASITFEGKGFKMTMVRSIITAIYMASRTQFPNSVFGDIETAAKWLSARAQTLGPSQILAAVEQIRA